jgi:hypothetical protein
MRVLFNVRDDRRFVEVSGGEAIVLDARGLLGALEHGHYSGDGVGNIYVIAANDTLTPASVATRCGEFNEDDYAVVEVEVDGYPVGSYTIDGRA